MEEAILIPIAFFGFIIALVSMRNKQRLEEMKVLRGQGAGTEVTNELQQLKRQVQELRDVTTQYDMSFDNALHRVEGRMAGVEQRLQAVEERSDSVQMNRLGQ